MKRTKAERIKALSALMRELSGGDPFAVCHLQTAVCGMHALLIFHSRSCLVVRAPAGITPAVFLERLELACESGHARLRLQSLARSGHGMHSLTFRAPLAELESMAVEGLALECKARCS